MHVITFVLILSQMDKEVPWQVAMLLVDDSMRLEYFTFPNEKTVHTTPIRVKAPQVYGKCWACSVSLPEDKVACDLCNCIERFYEKHGKQVWESQFERSFLSELYGVFGDKVYFAARLIKSKEKFHL